MATCVPEVTGLVGPHPGEGVGHGGRLESLGRHGLEVNDVRHLHLRTVAGSRPTGHGPDGSPMLALIGGSRSIHPVASATHLHQACGARRRAGRSQSRRMCRH